MTWIPLPPGRPPASARVTLAAPGPGPVLDLRDVTFRRGSREILHGITFAVHGGEHWALLGLNGAGKSTILGFCGALTHPTSGTVSILGRQLGRVELQALRRAIGHVNPRHSPRPPLTVREVILTGITGTLELPLRWQPQPRRDRPGRRPGPRPGPGREGRREVARRCPRASAAGS